MLRIKSNFNGVARPLRGVLIGALALLLVALGAAAGLCAEVAFETARQVAERKLAHHLALYGSWNGHAAPAVLKGEAVRYDRQVVAFNFTVEPSGHVLVAVDDAFSPVLLYSERSRFEPERAFDPGAIESWIVPELDHRVGALKQYRRNVSLQKREPAPAGTRIKAAWDYFSDPAERHTAVPDALALSARTAGTAGTAPLLSTAWGQADPYNLMTPGDGSCAHTLTGCVATAWAQLMRYHQWPEQGTGSHSYPWNGTRLEADFNVLYRWDLMPSALTGSTPEAQNAVALLMRHAGIAAEMDYGCSVSGSTEYASNILDTYFRYKAMKKITRAATPSSEEWLNHFRTEFEAGRPVIFSIFTTDNSGGHEVVADGYQDDATDLIHINYGWEGYRDGWYNVTTDFEAGGYLWGANSQVIVTGIEPDRGLPTRVDAGQPQIVDEGTFAQLAGSSGDAVERYEWRQVGTGDAIPKVTLIDAGTLSASFRAPSVSADTELVFMLKATNAARSVGFDKVVVTVRDTGSSSAVTPEDDRGGEKGSSGGCFITVLY